MRIALAGDGCDRDWIWDRPVEAAPAAYVTELAETAWAAQWEHLVAASPFYASKLGGSGARPTLAELPSLPFTSKDDLRLATAEAPPFGAYLAVEAERVKRVYQTSGTTGHPSVIALTAEDVATWTAIGARTYYATGIHGHHAVLSTFGAGPFVAGHTNFVLEAIGARVVPVGPGDSERVVFAIHSGLVDTLLVTPSFAQHLANRHGAGALQVDHIVTGGEPGGGIPAIRDHVQTAFGATVNEVMGIGDIAPSLFGECPLQEGMHFCGTGYVWPELVDPDSRAPVVIEPGAVGELVYTHLQRQAMPLVRYLGGDIVRIEGTECGCERTSFRMRCLGRRDDMFIVRGVNVYPAAVVAVVAEFRPAVTGRARVVRPADGAVAVEPPIPVEVEIPAGGGLPPRLKDEIEAAIRARLTFRARVEPVFEDSFGDAVYKTRLAVTRQP